MPFVSRQSEDIDVDIIDQDALPKRALAAAENLLANRFAGAALAFVAGSIMRGQGTTASDIDLVIVFPSLDRAWRESLFEAGFPVEVFVHDRQTLQYYLDKDVESGCPIMIDIVSSGRVIGSDAQLAQRLQSQAIAMMAQGPKLAEPDFDWLRYRVSDLADDLRGDRPAAEIRAIAAQLYPLLADLMLLGRGMWTGRGKWAPRLLLRLKPELAEAFDRAFQHAVAGNAAPMLALADAELAGHGGPYFAGYRQDAPVDARHLTP